MQRIKFIDRMSTGKLSRRDMLKSAAAFGVGLAALPRPGAAAEVLTCLEWSGYDSADYFNSFVGKHGGPPNFSIFASEDDALAKVRAGFAADVMHPCNYSVNRFVTAGLAVPIDTAKLSNWKDIFPALQTADGVVSGGNVVMAPADWGNSSIAYRPDLIGDAFKDGETWGIFFDEKYKDKVALLDDYLVIQIGAMVNGMPYDKAYLLAGADLEAAKPMAAKAVQVNRMLWTDATEIQQALASGEIIAAYAWNDTIKNLTAQGIPVAYAKPKEGYFTWFCGLTLLNSGKADPALAYDFIDAWLSPETGKALIEGSGYGHANMKSFALASPDSIVAMGIKDPAEHMKSAILFKTMPNEVINEQSKVWEELKALKQ